MKNYFDAMNHLYIKNMVCNRCIRVVKEELEKLSIVIKKISLGEVETESIINKETLEIIREMLEQNGFELIEDKKVKIIEKVKNIIIETIYGNEEFLSVSKNFSKLLEKEIGLDYRYMSTLFSSLESITIEQYIIIQKIERAKEFLKYGELTLSEIAYKLGYSSVQHLSNQFKKITGFSASEFKNITQNMRRPIDKLS